jgi:hypothetical protein
LQDKVARSGLFIGGADAMLCGSRLKSESQGTLMKHICTLLGIALLIIAVVYFMLPADQLPSFFPGHEAGLMRPHVKHGVVAAVAGVGLLALGWIMGRRV